MFEVYIPVAPQIEQGTMTVKLQALSQIARQDFEVEVEILVRIFMLLLIALRWNVTDWLVNSLKELPLLGIRL